MTHLKLPTWRACIGRGPRGYKRSDERLTEEINEKLTQHPDILDPKDRSRLEDLLETTDLIEIRHQIADIQGNLIELARRRGTIKPKAKSNAIYLSRRKVSPPKRAKRDESTNHRTRAS